MDAHTDSTDSTGNAGLGWGGAGTADDGAGGDGTDRSHWTNADWDALWLDRLAQQAVTARQGGRAGVAPAGRRSAPASSANRWAIALVAHLLGLGVTFLAAMVLAFLAVLLVLVIGLSSIDELTPARLLVIAATPIVAALVLGVVAQALFLRHLGLPRPWAAPTAAAAAGLLLGVLVSSATTLLEVSVPGAGYAVLASVVEIAVVALVITDR
jgi:hypothetical protein